MKFKKTIAATAAVSALLSGCSPIPVMDIEKEKPATVVTAKKSIEVAPMWDDLPVLTEGKASIVLLTPMSLPQEVQDRRIVVDWDTAVTVKDVVATVSGLGVPVIIADQEIEEKPFFMPHFKGTIGQLLSAVSKATNTWFTYENGMLVASSKVKIGVTLPQEKEFGESIKKGLTGIGVKESAVTWEAGIIFAEVTPDQFPRAKLILERMTANAAVVNLQVSVINVTLNQSAKQGIDWDGLTIAATKGGTRADIVALKKETGLTGNSTPAPVQNNQNNNNNLNNNGTGTGTGTGTGGTTSTTGTDSTNTAKKTTVDGAMSAIEFAGQALNGAIFTKRFNLGAMFNFLQSYGDAQTDQNVVLKTVSGKKVEFNSLIQVPYVSEIGNTSTANTQNTTASTKTEKADDGITVALTPTYDAASNVVSVDVEMSLKAVIAFNELSAGNQLGTLTQPTTANREINNTIRMRPGETVVLGGLTYNSVSDNRAGPTFLQKGSRLESQSLTVSRQTMYIVIRPSIVKLGTLEIGTQGNGDNALNFLQPAAK